MEKWRMNLGVTGLRPPPGGAQAAQMVISWNGNTNRCERENGRKFSWEKMFSNFPTKTGVQKAE